MSDWIPVTERLPKQGEFVLTLDLERSVIEGHMSNGTVIGNYVHFTNYLFGSEKEWGAIAWMPLPEPYEPKEEQ